MTVEAFAPAKVNLTLHVTGQRPDGYHLLDSLVAFAGVGDRILVAPSDRLTLTVTGPFAAVLGAGDDNLVLRAARFLGDSGAAITLTKELPLASGIGGGSSDAAATLRALAQMWRRPLPRTEATAALGADVPVCLEARTRRMSGIGEALAEAPPLPPAWFLLANPGVAVPTAAIFQRLLRKDGRPMPARLPRCESPAILADFLASQRNDLEDPARAVAPVVGLVLSALSRQQGCLIARMSGSGATCFGLFAAEDLARRAAADLARAEPGWWVRAAPLLS